MGFLQDLRAELDTGHPNTGAYDADSTTAATELNEPNRKLTEELISINLIRKAIDSTEFGALATTGERQEILQILQFQSIDLRHFEFGRFRTVFGPSSTTVTSLTALRDRLVGRGEELKLGIINSGQVLDARALP